jgi:hypothetical protein
MRPDGQSLLTDMKKPSDIYLKYKAELASSVAKLVAYAEANPEVLYTDLAHKFGMSRQMCAYYLRRNGFDRRKPGRKPNA